MRLAMPTGSLPTIPVSRTRTTAMAAAMAMAPSSTVNHRHRTPLSSVRDLVVVATRVSEKNTKKIHSISRTSCLPWFILFGHSIPSHYIPSHAIHERADGRTRHIAASILLIAPCFQSPILYPFNPYIHT